MAETNRPGEDDIAGRTWDGLEIAYVDEETARPCARRIATRFGDITPDERGRLMESLLKVANGYEYEEMAQERFVDPDGMATERKQAQKQYSKPDERLLRELLGGGRIGGPQDYC